MKSVISAVCVATALSMGSASGYSIVNVPTANQAPLGEVNVAYYSMSVHDLPVSHKNIGIVYATVAPRLELENTYIDINNGAKSQNVFNASYKLLAESKGNWDVVVGAKNIFSDDNSPDPDEQKTSYYLATAKTLNPPTPGEKWHSIYRVHVNYGTREHRGLFGGLQVAITPRLGFVAMKFTNSGYADLFFGNTSEYAVVYSLGKNAPNLKVGTLGKHDWAGVDYSLRF